MKIDDLKAQTEDVEVTEEPQLTQEQKETQEKFLRGAVVKKYKLALKNLYQVMLKHKVNISGVKQLIKDKVRTLPFTASQRAFILSFKDEFLVQLLKDLYFTKYLDEIDLTTSENVSSEIGDSGDVQSNS